MNFASYTYATFLAIAFVVHWTIPESLRRPFLIVASYVFYASWDWRFCFLLLALSLFNWAFGRFVLARERTEYLSLGIAINLLPLIVFKYSAFAVANLNTIAGIAGSNGFPIPALILPLGISFFTFQGIAYLVDVAAGDEPFIGVGHFLLYKSFWPQLIAGPIIRPGEIREQITRPRTIDYDDVSSGCRRIITGLVKKVVFADTIGPLVDPVFLLNASPNAIDVGVATLGFGLQIYFDFAGYCDIAIGSARLFGFRFPENFDYPYASRSFQEFWSRWHMTLSRWIRDYIFTPLAFTLRGQKWALMTSTLLAMALCGLWHGARWTFVLWGVWHGLLLLLNQAAKPFFSRTELAPVRYRLRGVAAWAITLVGVESGWLLFRSQSIQQALDYATALFTLRGGFRPAVLRENAILIIGALFIGLVLVQIVRRAYLSSWADIHNLDRVIHVMKPVAYVLLLTCVIVFDREATPFVYFQF